MRRTRIPTLLENGFSLPEMMIALAISMIGLLAFTSMQVAQTNELKAAYQQLSRQDLIRTVTDLLGSNAECTLNLQAANLTNPSQLTFDSRSVSAARPHMIQLRRLSMAGSATPVAEPGGLATALSNSLRIAPAASGRSGIELEVESTARGTIVINYGNGPGDRQIAPSRFPIRIQTTGPAAATRITGCAERSVAGLSGVLREDRVGDHTFIVPPGVSAIRVTITGGGGAGGGARATNPALSQSSAGTGGNGSAMVVSVFAVTPGARLNFHVGAGGVGALGANGAEGEESWFRVGSDVMRAPGAQGGIAAPVAIGAWTFGPMWATRNGTGGNVLNGSERQGNIIVAGHCNNIVGGAGADGPWGGGGSSLGTGFPGAPAEGFGGGGSGASSYCVSGGPAPRPAGEALAGGNGKRGVVIIEW